MDPAYPWAGRVAVITGAARGAGAAIARRLARGGARVALLDLDADAVAATSADFDSEAKPLPHVVDIRDRSAVQATVGAVAAEMGRIDVLVNNAGRWTVGPFMETQPDDWHADVDVNFYGTLHMIHAVLPTMLDAGFGRIVNIVSDSGRVGEPRVAVYAASKAAVAGFSRALAKEVGSRGVTVNCVSLSTVRTPGAEATFTADQFDRMPRFYPVGRLGDVEDAAAAVAYFASPAAEWVTGQTLSVNGGYAML